MKQIYLNELKRLLTEFEITKNELDDILTDYSGMYDDGIEKGMTDAEVIDFLGKPEKVVADLGENYRKIQKKRVNPKIIALMPFLCVIGYFLLGSAGYWHPGWMIFFLIPISGIIVGMANTRGKHMLTALSPFIAVTVFLTIGFTTSIWHPTWLVFLLIPVIAIASSGTHRKPLETLTALSPFIAVTVFFLLGDYGLWNPGWLVFLIIPIIGILNMENKVKSFFFELMFAIAIIGYLYAGYQYGEWGLGALAFLLPVAYGILIGEVHLEFGGKDLATKIVVIVAIAVYFAGGFLVQAWAYLWLVFLAIPVTAILRYGKKKDVFVAISPFIAVTVFFLLGYFFQLWQYSWMAFMLIPISAILKNK